MNNAGSLDNMFPDFQEFQLISNFSEFIPTRAQRGISTFDLEFTCIDSNGPFFAIGSNAGVVYLFDRAGGQMHKLKDSEHKDGVTCVKVLISLECLVTVGFKSGSVLVYKVSFQGSQIEKFTVDGLHSCSITALEWSKNGIKFFSGDESGLVVCTEIDHFEHQSRSNILVRENIKIIQLSYSHQTLVISTLFRSIIFSTDTNTSVQVGSKERKCFGSFGAVIFEDGEDLKIFASRPGQRIWKSDESGVILETMVFKNAILQTHPTIKTLNDFPHHNLIEFPFGCIFQYGSFLLVWCDVYFLLIDPNSKLIVAMSPKLDPIVDIAVSRKEIFILRGMRHIMRISSESDYFNPMKVPEESSLLEEILVPFKELSTFVKERSDSLALPVQNPSIFDWLKRKRSASTPVEMQANTEAGKETDKDASEPLPVMEKLDCDIPVMVEVNSKPVIDVPEIINKDFSNGNENDDIIFKPKTKKPKIKKKVHFATDAAPKREKKLYFPKKEQPANKHVKVDKKTILKSDKSDVVSAHKCETDSLPSSASSNLITDNTCSNVTSNSKAENELPNDNCNVDNSNCTAEHSGNLTNNNFDESASPSSLPYLIHNIKTLNDCSSTTKENDSSAEDEVKSIDESIFEDKTSKNHQDFGIKAVEINDADKLLEDVLNTYSQLKHMNSSEDKTAPNFESTTSTENAVNLNESSDAHSDKNSNCTVLSEAHSENLTDQNVEYDSVDNIYNLVNSDMNTSLPTRPQKITESSPLDNEISVRDSSYSEPPKYGVDWVEYKAPELLLDVSLSNHHIFCCDVQNQLYFSEYPHSGTLKWIKLSQPTEKIISSPNESVVWALYRGTIFAAVQKSSMWKDAEWIPIARDAISFSVEDTCGWYVKSNGDVIMLTGLSLTIPSTYPDTISFPYPALKVAIKDAVVWILSIKGQLYSKNFSDAKRLNSKWKEIVLRDVDGIADIHLGSYKTGWVIDSYGMIRFIIGVTSDTPDGTGKPWLVEASSYLFRPTTQFEQVMRNAFNSEILTSLIRGKQNLCLSTSDLGVWFCKTYDNLLYSNQRSVIGHMWEPVIPPTTAAATKWSLIASNAITDSDGVLWCVNSLGELFCYILKTKEILTVELPSIRSIECLQPSKESVWLLSSDGVIYIRRGITHNCLQGTWWQALDLLQLATHHVIHISCSQFVSWACTEEGEIFMRLGSLCPNYTKLNQAWISIGTANEDAASPLVKLSAIGKHFPLPLVNLHSIRDDFRKVFVGPLGYPVWAVDRKQNVYVREGVTTNFPVGTKWSAIPELFAKDLCISKSAVWLLEASGNIYRRFGITEANPCGDYWKQIPGKLDFLSVTEDDDLWGLQNDSMFCHFSFALYNMASGSSKKTPSRLVSEDDWEDILDDEFDL